MKVSCRNHLFSVWFNSACVEKFRYDIKSQEPTEPSVSALSFIVRGPDIPGTFFPEKADRLGVPKTCRSQLVKGNSVTLASGVQVQPQDCVGPSMPGSLILYMDVPSPDYLDSLLCGESSGRILEPLQRQTPGNQVDLVVHQITKGVLEDKRYQAWLLSFGPKTHHVLVGSDFCDSRAVFTSSALLAYYFHRSAPAFFASYWFSNESPYGELPLPCLQVAEPLMQLNFGKKFGIDKSMVIPFTDDSLLMPSSKPFLFQPVMTLPSPQGSAVPPHYSGIILGSGSAIPSKYRNVSSVYFDIPGYGTMLLDAGEGSHGQLFRALGPEHLRDALLRLRVIFVSHLHADHHLGSVRFLYERKRLVTAHV
jgi:ribonuclease Z